MTANPCPCGRPSDSTALCAACHHDLQVALEDISSHWRDLDTVKGRQTRYGGQGGRGTSEKPLMMDARFGGLQWVEVKDAEGRIIGYDSKVPDGTMLQEAVKNTIGTWGRIVLEERPILAGPAHPACLHISCSTHRRSRPPRDDVASVCRYLLGQADWIRTQHWAPEMLDELTYTAEQLRRMVDRPADRWYAGLCSECFTALYAKVGAPEVVCKECNHTTLVKDRRTTMLREAADKLVPAAVIARAVSWLGEDPLTSAKVRLWGHRKQLKVREYIIPVGEVGPVCNLRPLYRLGDACDLMALGDGRRRRTA